MIACELTVPPTAGVAARRAQSETRADAAAKEHVIDAMRGFAALLGAGNAAGGYVVTERMLEMFKPSAGKPGDKA